MMMKSFRIVFSAMLIMLFMACSDDENREVTVVDAQKAYNEALAIADEITESQAEAENILDSIEDMEYNGARQFDSRDVAMFDRAIEQIEAIKACFPTEIATLVKPFTEEDGLEALENPNSPKVVFAKETGNALLFSRSVIPYLRGVAREDWLKQKKHYKHIGMYAYRADILREITRLPQSEAEKNESLEQLRWLENGYRIRVAETNVQSIGIDTPEDLLRAEKMLEARQKTKDERQKTNLY